MRSASWSGTRRVRLLSGLKLTQTPALTYFNTAEDVKEWMRAELAALEAEPVVQVVAEQPGQGDTTMQDGKSSSFTFSTAYKP